MKILRIKTFSRRDELPEPFPINPSWIGKYDTIEVRLEFSEKYNKDIKLLGTIDKKIVDNFKRDLKNLYFYTDGPAGGDTHYLKDFSRPGRYHRCSKSISTIDRMVYAIYPPELDENDRVVYYPVVIQNLIGHEIPGEKKYSTINA